eukprot:6179537-Pleurochrysis_carterae.AAC.2
MESFDTGNCGRRTQGALSNEVNQTLVHFGKEEVKESETETDEDSCNSREKGTRTQGKRASEQWRDGGRKAKEAEKERKKVKRRAYIEKDHDRYTTKSASQS